MKTAPGPSANALHAAWSSLTFGKSGRQRNAFLGWHRWFYCSYPNNTEKDADGYDLFNPTWKVDCNRHTIERIKRARRSLCNSSRTKRVNRHSRALQGKDLLCHRTGSRAWRRGGALTCIDAKTGKVVWKNTDIGRTISTISVADDLVYLAEYAGIIHCLDANTGKGVLDVHVSFSRIWGSTLVVDGKVLLGNEDGDLLVMDHGKDKPKVKLVGMGAPVYSSPVFCKRYALHRDANPLVRDRKVNMDSDNSSSGRSLVWLLFVVMFLAHQDFWWWEDSSLVFGFLPIGLATIAFFHRMRPSWLARHSHGMA